jgi:hypothetical protein
MKQLINGKQNDTNTDHLSELHLMHGLWEKLKYVCIMN